MSDAEDSVRKCYSTWGKSYYDDYYQNNDAYPPVHTNLIRKELVAAGVETLLDAGCGPASILRDLTDIGADLFGFDLTPEMLEECKLVMEGLGYRPEHFWLGSVTEEKSFVGPPSAPSEYDAAVCVGVLPHIPKEQDQVVFENLRKSVKTGGLVMVEARNELFSLFTLNRYTSDFFENSLLPVERYRDEAGAEIDEVLGELKRQFRMDLPPVRKGKEDEPGYDEVLSRTHNPLELKTQFEMAGFRDVRTLFYHFHAFPPMLEARNPALFRSLSLEMEKNPEDWRGHFMASAFFVTGVAE